VPKAGVGKLQPAGRMRPASRLTTLCGPRNKLQLLWHFILIAAVEYFTENSDIYKISHFLSMLLNGAITSYEAAILWKRTG
jgi:hypothetical protein